MNRKPTYEVRWTSVDGAGRYDERFDDEQDAIAVAESKVAAVADDNPFNYRYSVVLVLNYEVNGWQRSRSGTVWDESSGRLRWTRWHR